MTSASSSVARKTDKSRSGGRQMTVIMSLNLILRGWAMHHRGGRGDLLTDRSSRVDQAVGGGPDAATRASPCAGSRRGTSGAIVRAIGSSHVPIGRRSWPSGRCCSRLLGCPSSATQMFAAMPIRSTRHGRHTSSVAPMPSVSAATNPVRTRAAGRFEPCAEKLACPVLRGEHADNGVFLPDGKARTPYEFGVKVSVAVTAREGIVVGLTKQGKLRHGQLR